MQHRRSKQRQGILEAMERHGGHLTADQIYALVRAKFPRLSLGTVYRNLRVLIAQGAVRELNLGGSFSHFEVAKETHYHFVCRLCGRIEDADVPVDRRFTALAQRSARAGGFRVEEHRLDFVGVCSACQRKRPRAPRRSKVSKSREA